MPVAATAGPYRNFSVDLQLVFARTAVRLLVGDPLGGNLEISL